MTKVVLHFDTFYIHFIHESVKSSCVLSEAEENHGLSKGVIVKDNASENMCIMN